jgi:hypothetical protein
MASVDWFDAADLASDKSPRLHDVGEPAVEFFVRGDFKKKMIVDEPYLARLSHSGIESDERGGWYAGDLYIVLLTANARRSISQETFVRDRGAIDGSDVHFKTGLSRGALRSSQPA